MNSILGLTGDEYSNIVLFRHCTYCSTVSTFVSVFKNRTFSSIIQAMHFNTNKT